MDFGRGSHAGRIDQALIQYSASFSLKFATCNGKGTVIHIHDMTGSEV